MGLSHVLFTAVNGSRNWGPLAFTLRPLGDWGGGCLHVSERERRVHPVLNTTSLLDDIHFQASSVLAMVTVKQQDMGKQNPEWRKSTETITLSMCLQSVDF